MSERRSTTIDMSPAAVFRRLREASDLLTLCLSLGKARRIGPVEEASEEPQSKDPAGTDARSGGRESR